MNNLIASITRLHPHGPGAFEGRRQQGKAVLVPLPKSTASTGAPGGAQDTAAGPGQPSPWGSWRRQSPGSPVLGQCFPAMVCGFPKCQKLLIYYFLTQNYNTKHPSRGISNVSATAPVGMHSPVALLIFGTARSHWALHHEPGQAQVEPVQPSAFTGAAELLASCEHAAPPAHPPHWGASVVCQKAAGQGGRCQHLPVYLWRGRERGAAPLWGGAVPHPENLGEGSGTAVWWRSCRGRG